MTLFHIYFAGGGLTRTPIMARTMKEAKQLFADMNGVCLSSYILGSKAK